MSTCNNYCPVWNRCGYEYKGMCDCVHQRKFKPIEVSPEPPPPESKGLDLEADAKTIRESLDVLEWGHDAAYEALDRITDEVRRLRAGAEGGDGGRP